MPQKIIDANGFQVVGRPVNLASHHSALFSIVEEIHTQDTMRDLSGLISTIERVQGQNSPYFLLRLKDEPGQHLFQDHSFVKRHLRVDAIYSGKVGFSVAHYSEVYIKSDAVDDKKVVHVYFNPNGHCIDTSESDPHVCEQAKKNANQAQEIVLKLIALQTKKLTAAIKQTIHLEKSLCTAYRTMPASWEKYQQITKDFINAVADINRYNDTFTDSRGLLLQEELDALIKKRHQATTERPATEADLLDDLIDEPAKITKSQEKRIKQSDALVHRQQIIAELLDTLRPAYNKLTASASRSRSKVQALVEELNFQQQYRNQFIELYCMKDANAGISKVDSELIQSIDTLLETLNERALNWFRQACYEGNVDGVKQVFPYLKHQTDVDFYLRYLKACLICAEKKGLNASFVAICELFYTSGSPQYLLSIRQIRHLPEIVKGELVGPLISVYKRECYDTFEMLLRHGYDSLALAACVDNRRLWLSNLYYLATEQHKDVYRYIACLQRYGRSSVNVIESKYVISHLEMADEKGDLSQLVSDRFDVKTGNVKASAVAAKRRNPIPQSEDMMRSIFTMSEKKGVYEAYGWLKSSLSAFIAFRAAGEESALLELLKIESVGVETLALSIACLLSATDVRNRLLPFALPKDFKPLMILKSEADTNKYCNHLTRVDVLHAPQMLAYPITPHAELLCQELNKRIPELTDLLAHSSDESMQRLYRSLMMIGDKMAESSVNRLAINSHVFYRAAFVLIFLKPTTSLNVSLLLKSQVKRYICADRLKLTEAPGCLAAIYNLLSCHKAFTEKTPGHFMVDDKLLTVEIYQLYQLLQYCNGKKIQENLFFVLQESKAMALQEYTFSCPAQERGDYFKELRDIGEFISGEIDGNRAYLRFKLPTGLLKKDFREKYDLTRCRVPESKLCEEQLQCLKTMHIKSVTIEKDYEKPGCFLITAPQRLLEEITQVIDHWQASKSLQP